MQEPVMTTPTPDPTISTARPPGAFRRGEWVVPALEVVLLIVLLVVSLDGLLAGIDAFLDEDLTTRVHVSDEVDALAVDGVRLTPETAELSISDPSWTERFAVAAPPIIEALVVGSVITLLLQVVRSLRAGDPFTRENATLLGRAALVAIIGGAIVVAASIVGPIVVDSGLPDDLPVDLVVEGSSASLYAGLILAAIAQVFRRGCLLRDELEGVV
jgi:hypothetical protein